MARVPADLPLDLTTDPETGEPGVRLELHGADGSGLSSERRIASSFTFAGTLPPGTVGGRVRAALTADDACVHELTASGVGRFRVLLDGDLVEEFTLVAKGNDPVEDIFRPPSHAVRVPLPAGRPVQFQVDISLPGHHELPIAGFAVSHRPPRVSDDEMIRRAAAAAADTDVAVVFVGTTDDVESEGFDRTGLALPGRQDELVWAVAIANPRTVVVVNAGSVYELPWADEVAAVLWAGMPGQEGGDAIADVLTGRTDPWGRLTATFPAVAADAPVYSVTPEDGVLAYSEGHGVGYRGYLENGTTPRWPFGFGLGYTAWPSNKRSCPGTSCACRCATAATGQAAR